MSIKIALVQINTVLGNIPNNLDTHLVWLDKARTMGADIVLFPELSLTGYVLQDLVLSTAVPAAASQPAFKRLLAESKDLDIVFGFVEVDRRSRYYIASAYLSQGDINHVHRKVYLPTYGIFDEKRFFTPGNKVRAFETRFGRVGILICEDFWHLSTPYLLWLDGADLFLCVAASPGYGMDAGDALVSEKQVKNILSAFAVQFTSFFAYTNRVGYEDGYYFPGKAMAVGPGGNLLAEAQAEEGITLVEIDMELLKSSRFRLPLLRDERPELVLRELQRILGER